MTKTNIQNFNISGTDYGIGINQMTVPYNDSNPIPEWLSVLINELLSQPSTSENRVVTDNDSIICMETLFNLESGVYECVPEVESSGTLGNIVIQVSKQTSPVAICSTITLCDAVSQYYFGQFKYTWIYTKSLSDTDFKKFIVGVPANILYLYKYNLDEEVKYGISYNPLTPS